MRKTRLFVKADPLKPNQEIILKDNDFDYLVKVLRKKTGDEVFVFNGFDGEFSAKITDIQKKSLTITLINKVLEQENSSFITLAFAPVKNVRIDFVAAKATEMGVSKFLPILTKHTIVDKINLERFQANIKEAAEQCETNFVPEVFEIQKLDKLLEQKDAIFILCDETHQGQKSRDLMPQISAQRKPNQEIIILIGPEGGFSKEEFDKMRKVENLYSMSLGKRILRADTAIIAALSLVNELL